MNGHNSDKVAVIFDHTIEMEKPVDKALSGSYFGCIPKKWATT